MMNAEEINKILKEAGVTQADIADNLEPTPVRQSAVNQVIHRKQTSKRIQVAIFDVANTVRRVTFEDIWGRSLN